MISIESRDRIALVKLNRGTTNPISLDLLEALSAELTRIKMDDDHRGLVLTSSQSKFFSIGFDIPALYPLDKKGMGQFFRAFNRVSLELYTFPKPTIAAVTGHAVAGGCILTLCCDQRFIAEGHKLMGLNEVKLGVSIPYPSDCILRDLVGSRISREIVEGGEFYPPEDSLRLGMVDRILPLDQVIDEAIKEVGRLGATPAHAFAQIKRDRTERIEKQALALQGEKEEKFLFMWFAPETRKQLEKAMEKF